MTSINLNRKTVHIHEGIPGSDFARWTISHRMQQARIHVAHAAIADTAWADEYFDHRRALDEGGSDVLAHWKALSRCIGAPCLPLLEPLALAADKAMTLADYCLPATVSLRIVRDSSSPSISDAGDGVRAELVSGPHPSPASGISPMPMHRLPATLPRFSASKLLVGDEAEMEEAMLRLEPPLRVWAADDDDDDLLVFFKPCMRDREAEFVREMDVLAGIGEARLHERRINVPRMAGVATAEDGATVLGVLLQWIGGATPLAAEEMAVARVGMHGLWEEEVRGIIGALHGDGIVWGDVNPHNIVIDDGLAPWVVDFGGGCNAEFLDEENRETVTGDWQGFHRVFDCWLPAKAAASSSS